MVVFYPKEWAGEEIHGAFVVDSFYYMKKANGKKHEYMLEMLQHLWDVTGHVFLAVCSGGAALSQPHGSGAYFQQLLAFVPAGLKIIIAVICGNDFLDSSMRVRCYKEEWDAAAMLLCEEMKAKSQKQFAVVGMSSSTWNYSKWMSIDQRVLYDKNAVRLGKAFARSGVSSDNGVSELHGIVPQDDIGHVLTDSQATVFAAFVSWVGRAETHGQTSTFTGSPPPPSKDLPAGWRSFWSGEHGCFWYLHKETAGRSWEKPPSVPDGWLVKWSTEYECFQFVNPKLQVCTWGPPSVGDESWVEVEVEEEPKESEVEDTDGVEGDDEDDGEEDEVESEVWVEPPCSQFVVPCASVPPPPPAPDGEIPLGWMVMWSAKEQCHYFYHAGGNVSTWERPPCVPDGWVVTWSIEHECS